MTRARTGIVIGGIALLGAAWWAFTTRGGSTAEKFAPGIAGSERARSKAAPTTSPLQPTPAPETDPAPRAPAPAEISVGEKAARVAQIKRDYDEIGKRFADEFTAAGKNFPGGLNAYLRQLALMEREKWADIAGVLSPGELEDLQMVDTRAGQLVAQWLGGSPATEEQRRTVFRLQKAFDDRFALTFDTTPVALYERELQRHAMLVAIAGVLGETELFPLWMRSDGGDYAKAAAFVSTRGLPPSTTYTLWEIRHDFTAGRLKILTQPGLLPEQIQAAQRELAKEIRAKLQGILGPDGVQAGAEVLNWLPAN